jgi:hypothetical protein
VVVGTGGYLYFGAARNLPGVRELLEKKEGAISFESSSINYCNGVLGLNNHFIIFINDQLTKNDEQGTKFFKKSTLTITAFVMTMMACLKNWRQSKRPKVCAPQNPFGFFK